MTTYIRTPNGRCASKMAAFSFYLCCQVGSSTTGNVDIKILQWHIKKIQPDQRARLLLLLVYKVMDWVWLWGKVLLQFSIHLGSLFDFTSSSIRHQLIKTNGDVDRFGTKRKQDGVCPNFLSALSNDFEWQWITSTSFWYERMAVNFGPRGTILSNYSVTFLRDCSSFLLVHSRRG